MPRVHNEATVEDIVKVFKDLGVPEEKLSYEVHGSFDDFIDRHAELLLAILKCTGRPTMWLIETALAERFMNSLTGTRTTFASMVVSAVSYGLTRVPRAWRNDPLLSSEKSLLVRGKHVQHAKGRAVRLNSRVRVPIRLIRDISTKSAPLEIS